MHHYHYDEQNRLIQVDGTLGTCSTATACYTYFPDGKRAEKNVAGYRVDYLYDTEGHRNAVLNAALDWISIEVYAGGSHLATYSGGTTGTTYFIQADWLGTERARTTVTGVLCETISSLSFGDGMSTSGSCGDPSPMHFTGKQRDTESSLDNFEARYMASSLGRFMSPDWSDDPDPVPYADLGDPQSLNLYLYAENNPTSLTDSDGHDPCPASQGLATGAGCAITQSPDPALKPPLIDRILNVLFGGAGTVPPDPSTQHLGPPSPAPSSGSTPRPPVPNAYHVGFGVVVLAPTAAGSELGPGDLIVLGGLTGVYLYKNRETWGFMITEAQNFLHHVHLTDPNQNPDPGNRSKWRRELQNKLDKMRSRTKRLSPKLQQQADQLIDELQRMLDQD
jgi:RHS repeat-associated protein